MPAIEADFAASDVADRIYFDEDMPGFGLRLRKGGKRGTWVCRYEFNAIQRKITLGHTHLLSPEEARAMAKQAMAYRHWFGEDPQTKKAEELAKAKVTLAYIAKQYLSIKKPQLRPRSYRDAQRYLLKSFKPLHQLPVHKIARRDVAVVINDLAQTSAAAAGQAKVYLSALFTWAIGEGLCEINPTQGTNTPTIRTERNRVLSNTELASVWHAAQDDTAGYIVKLLILTGQRRDEVGGMTWSELNHNNGEWKLPANRTKNRREHVLPLPEMAWSLIEKQPHRPGNDRLFGIGSRGYNNWFKAKIALDARAGFSDWRLHDLRRTMATRMADIGVQPHIIEALLNHASGHRAGVAGVYNRSIYANQMKSALALWADFVRSKIAPGGERKIIAIPVA